MNTFMLNISSPDGNIFEGEAVKLDVRGVEGELAVMAGHTSFVTYVKASPCTVHLPDGSKKTISHDGGLLTVGENKVTFLTEKAENNKK